MRVVFMGSGEIGVPVLRSLLAREKCEVVAVVTQPDRPSGRGLEMREGVVKTLAREAGVPVLQPGRVRNAEAVADLAAYRADVIVVMAYGQILPVEILEMPAVACLNLHASLLPRWRGAAPIQAAIAAGDEQTGVTVMYMAAGLDTGDVLLMREIEIAADETGGSLHDRLAELAPEALAEALTLLERGEAPRVVQDEAGVSVTRKLSRDDGRIDWSRSAVEIERLVRAMNPWPGATCELEIGGTLRKLKVWEVAVSTDGKDLREGECELVDGAGIRVGTGDGAVDLFEIQAEGKRRMAAADWARGLR